MIIDEKWITVGLCVSVKCFFLLKSTLERYRLTWTKILLISFFWIFLWIFYDKNNLLVPDSEESTTENQTCLYNPSSQYYALRLKPKTNVFPIKNLESNDYKKLIDLKDFKFNINEPDKCLNTNILLLVVVTSAVQNFERRHVIRTTWGQPDSKVRVLFMLGAVLSHEMQGLVQVEHEQNRDIIQGSFMDTYKNLTYKTMMTLKYVVYHCPNAIYIFKTDDDVFINTPLMKNYLSNDLSPFGAYNLLQCIVFTTSKPLRGNSKWALTEEEFPDSKLPIYCNGAWALFSPDVLFKLYKEGQTTRFLYLEDIFLYGIAGGKVKGLRHSDIRNLTLSYKDVFGLAKGWYDNMNFLIGTFGMTSSQLVEYWNYVVSKPARSSVYDYNELDTT